MKYTLKKYLNILSGNTKKIKKINLGFIVSTGRTGTNFFEDFLTTNFANLLAKHEPNPDLFHVSVNAIRKRLTASEIKSEVLYARKKIINEVLKSNANYYIETNPFLAPISPVLHEKFEAKILHIIRHPDTYIHSAMNKDPNDSNNYFMSDTDHRNRLNSNDFKSDKYHNKWAQMNQFERICWNWVYTNTFIYDSLHNKSNYTMLKFEDLFITDSKKSIEKIIDFFEISNRLKRPTAEIVNDLKVKRNNTTTFKYESFDKIKSENIKFYNEIITPELLKKFGY